LIALLTTPAGRKLLGGVGGFVKGGLNLGIAGADAVEGAALRLATDPLTRAAGAHLIAAAALQKAAGSLDKGGGGLPLLTGGGAAGAAGAAEGGAVGAIAGRLFGTLWPILVAYGVKKGADAADPGGDFGGLLKPVDDWIKAHAGFDPSNTNTGELAGKLEDGLSATLAALKKAGADAAQTGPVQKLIDELERAFDLHPKGPKTRPADAPERAQATKPQQGPELPKGWKPPKLTLEPPKLKFEPPKPEHRTRPADAQERRDAATWEKILRERAALDRDPQGLGPTHGSVKKDNDFETGRAHALSNLTPPPLPDIGPIVAKLQGDFGGLGSTVDAFGGKLGEAGGRIAGAGDAISSGAERAGGAANSLAGALEAAAARIASVQVAGPATGPGGVRAAPTGGAGLITHH
jgi:hypothetical protein